MPARFMLSLLLVEALNGAPMAKRKPRDIPPTGRTKPARQLTQRSRKEKNNRLRSQKLRNDYR